MEAALEGPIWPLQADLFVSAAEQAEDAISLLDADYSLMPQWCLASLRDTLGPILPGITVIAARPGCGKTTLILNQVRHAIATGKRTILVGMETSPARLRLRLAAMKLGYAPYLVEARQWDRLPLGARDHLRKAVEDMAADTYNSLVIVPNDRVTVSELTQWIEYAAEEGYPLVLVDHIHEMQWGSVDNLTQVMAEGIRGLRSLVAQTEQSAHPVSLVLAAQLNRPQGYDVLAEYMPPPLSALKQCGAIEEVARLVLLLHRTIRRDATAGDIRLVRQGQLPVSAVAEEGTITVAVGKARDNGSLKDREIRMYVHHDLLYSTAEERDSARQKEHGGTTWVLPPIPGHPGHQGADNG